MFGIANGYSRQVPEEEMKKKMMMNEAVVVIGWSRRNPPLVM